jgi:ankyrin repeat protein
MKPGPAFPPEIWLMIAEDLPTARSLVSLATTSHSLYNYLFALLMRKAARLSLLRGLKTTVLHWASSRGHVRIVTGLLKVGADVNAVDREDRSALMVACVYGYEDVVESLLAYDPDLDMSSKHETALTIAASCHHLGILTALFHHGAKFDRQHWWTLLSAVSGGHLEVAKLLLEHGADPNYQLSRFDVMPSPARQYVGHTAIYFAVFNEHPDLIALLMKNGANADPALELLVPKWRNLSPPEEEYLYELCGRSRSRKMWWKFCQLCRPFITAIRKTSSHLSPRFKLFLLASILIVGSTLIGVFVATKQAGKNQQQIPTS